MEVCLSKECFKPNSNENNVTTRNLSMKCLFPINQFNHKNKFINKNYELIKSQINKFSVLYHYTPFTNLLIPLFISLDYWTDIAAWNQNETKMQKWNRTDANKNTNRMTDDLTLHICLFYLHSYEWIPIFKVRRFFFNFHCYYYDEFQNFMNFIICFSKTHLFSWEKIWETHHFYWLAKKNNCLVEIFMCKAVVVALAQAKVHQ